MRYRISFPHDAGASTAEVACALCGQSHVLDAAESAVVRAADIATFLAAHAHRDGATARTPDQTGSSGARRTA